MQQILHNEGKAIKPIDLAKETSIFDFEYNHLRQKKKNH